MEPLEKRIARKSAQIYLPISLGAALVFLLLASAVGEYSATARIGGAVWIAILGLIVSMPLITSRVKNLERRRVSLSEE
jgi:hypothetical protein